MMKRKPVSIAGLASALVLWSCAAVVESAPADRFHGGASDGASSAAYTGYTAPVGGDAGRYIATGGYDGYASGRYVGYSPPAGGELGRFTGGGGYDGYAASDYDGYQPPAGGTLGRFVGGVSDGADSGGALDLSNPLAGDSDGDGVPDWWESANYLSLTVAGADTDLDGDGKGSLHEYHADTDPNDPLSQLTILSIAPGSPMRIEGGVTSPARNYWIETSTDLQSGRWSTATGEAVPGNGGVLEFELDGGLDDGHAFYRIRVALPDG